MVSDIFSNLLDFFEHLNIALELAFSYTYAAYHEHRRPVQYTALTLFSYLFSKHMSSIQVKEYVGPEREIDCGAAPGLGGCCKLHMQIMVIACGGDKHVGCKQLPRLF